MQTKRIFAAIDCDLKPERIALFLGSDSKGCWRQSISKCLNWIFNLKKIKMWIWKHWERYWGRNGSDLISFQLVDWCIYHFWLVGVHNWRERKWRMRSIYGYIHILWYVSKGNVSCLGGWREPDDECAAFMDTFIFFDWNGSIWRKKEWKSKWKGLSICVAAIHCYICGDFESLSLHHLHCGSSSILPDQ